MSEDVSVRENRRSGLVPECMRAGIDSDGEANQRLLKRSPMIVRIFDEIERRS
jgi:hypothetical protein